MRFISCKHVRPSIVQVDQPIFNSYSFKTGAKDILDFLNNTVKPINNK